MSNKNVVLYVGDLHSRVNDLSNVLNSAEARGIEHIVQVGDFGILWPNNSTQTMDDFFRKRAKQGKWKTKIYTCLGNHDAWPRFYELEKEQGYPNAVEVIPDSGLYFIPRGRTIDILGVKHLFMGGAESTDQERRKEGRDWWANEEGSDEEFERFYQALENEKPEVVVSHDAPLRVPLFRVRRKSSRTPNLLEKYLNKSSHYPKTWVYGHHHMLDKQKITGIKFMCCGLHGEYWEVDYAEKQEENTV